MKRRIAAAILVAVLPLGMAACGSQSKEDACKEVQNANLTLAQQAAATNGASLTDPQAAKEQFNTMLDAYKTAASKVSNKEVKPALDKVITDLETIKDFDFTTLNPSGEQMEAMTTFASDALQLNNICGIAADTK